MLAWMRYASVVIMIIFIFVPLFGTSLGQHKMLFREDFKDLNQWEPFYFEKIKIHSSYSIVSRDGETYLKAQSDGSASAIIYKGRFNVYEFPRARWRWKVENVYRKGDAKTKEGDDYPIRIYFIFAYDPKRAGFWKKLKYRSAKLVYGEYPPHSSLNYIWANKNHAETFMANTYAEESKMIPLRQGNDNVRKWVTEEVNILEDYKKAFGEEPPPVASIAIMNDSDNTGEKSVSYVDFIEIYSE